MNGDQVEEKINEIVSIGQKQQSAECALLLLLARVKQTSCMPRRLSRSSRCLAKERMVVEHECLLADRYRIAICATAEVHIWDIGFRACGRKAIAKKVMQ